MPGARRCDREVLSLQPGARGRQRRPHSLRRRVAEQLAERAPRFQRPLQPRPVPDRLVDRSQRPSQQDRAGDHDSRRDLAAQREPRSQPQHHRLQEQAQRLGERQVEPIAVGGRQGLVEEAVAQRPRPRQHGLEHAEALYRLASGAHLLDEVRGTRRSLSGLPLQRPGARLVDQRHREQQATREHCQHAEHPVKHEQHEQKHGSPRGVEEGERPRTRSEPLNRLEIAQTGSRTGTLGRSHGAHHDGPQHARVEPLLQACSDAGQDPPARMIQHPHEQEQERYQGGEGDQRRLRTRTQHPVVDLQHEQRPGQHQHVHRHAEQAARNEQPPALRERSPNLPVAAPTVRHHAAGAPCLRAVSKTSGPPGSWEAALRRRRWCLGGAGTGSG